MKSIPLSAIRTFFSPSNTSRTIPSKSSDQTLYLKQRKLDPSPLYFMYYIRKALLGMTIKHNLISENQLEYVVPFTLNKKAISGWNNALNIDNIANPFSFYLKSSTTIFLKLMKDCGVNFKNVFHIRNEISYANHNTQINPGEYKNHTKIKNISPSGKNAVIHTCSEIRNSEGKLILEINDYMMIRNVSKSNLDILKDEKLNYRSWLIPPKFKNHEVLKTQHEFIPKNRGIAYGKVSGDLAIIHTTHLAAKLFGFKKGFIQGLCTSNMVMVNCPFKIKNFNITFLKPVYIESNIRIEYSANAYRVMDNTNQVLAHGTYTSWPNRQINAQIQMDRNLVA